MTASKLVVFEGPDKVGKETQSKLFTTVLQNAGINVVRVEPAKEAHPRGKKLIYSMLDSGAAKRYPNVFQVVQFLNRMYFQYFRLPKLLEEHEIVIMDRWALSGFIYGACEGIVGWLNNWMYARAKKADLTIIFDGKSYRRGHADDSYEKDTVLQQRVKAMYQQLGTSLNDHVLIDNCGLISEVNERVLKVAVQHRILTPACVVCKADWSQDCDAGLHS